MAAGLRSLGSTLTVDSVRPSVLAAALSARSVVRRAGEGRRVAASASVAQPLSPVKVSTRSYPSGRTPVTTRFGTRLPTCSW